VLPNVGSEENLAEIASRFQEALRSHPGNFTWGPGCSASIGAAWVKAGSVTAAEAVAMADVAMYSAKRARNEKPVLWSADLLELAQEGIGAPA
jgi:GGDEF domain-containing protein